MKISSIIDDLTERFWYYVRTCNILGSKNFKYFIKLGSDYIIIANDSGNIVYKKETPRYTINCDEVADVDKSCDMIKQISRTLRRDHTQLLSGSVFYAACSDLASEVEVIALEDVLKKAHPSHVFFARNSLCAYSHITSVTNISSMLIFKIDYCNFEAYVVNNYETLYVKETDTADIIIRNINYTLTYFDFKVSQIKKEITQRQLSFDEIFIIASDDIYIRLYKGIIDKQFQCKSNVLNNGTNAIILGLIDIHKKHPELFELSRKSIHQ